MIQVGLALNPITMGCSHSKSRTVAAVVPPRPQTPETHLRDPHSDPVVTTSQAVVTTSQADGQTQTDDATVHHKQATTPPALQRRGDNATPELSKPHTSLQPDELPTPVVADPRGGPADALAATLQGPTSETELCLLPPVDADPRGGGPFDATLTAASETAFCLPIPATAGPRDGPAHPIGGGPLGATLTAASELISGGPLGESLTAASETELRLLPPVDADPHGGGPLGAILTAASETELRLPTPRLRVLCDTIARVEATQQEDSCVAALEEPSFDSCTMQADAPEGPTVAAVARSPFGDVGVVLHPVCDAHDTTHPAPDSQPRQPTHTPASFDDFDQQSQGLPTTSQPSLRSRPLAISLIPSPSPLMPASASRFTPDRPAGTTRIPRSGAALSLRGDAVGSLRAAMEAAAAADTDACLEDAVALAHENAATSSSDAEEFAGS